MDQAAVLDGLCFDLLPFCQDCRAAPEVNVGRCQIAEAFVISVMVVVLDEGSDRRLELALQVVIFEQDAVLEGLVPAFDLALRLGMVGSPAHMIHTVLLEVAPEAVKAPRPPAPELSALLDDRRTRPWSGAVRTESCAAAQQARRDREEGEPQPPASGVGHH